MTDRHSGYIIVLDRDMREDDARETIAALKQIKGVSDVQPLVADPFSMLAELRAKNELRDKFYNFYMSLWGDHRSSEQKDAET